MSRHSNDQYRDGQLYNGYDYDLQVWVLSGVVQDCGHKEKGNQVGPTIHYCCNGSRYAGQEINFARKQAGL